MQTEEFGYKNVFISIPVKDDKNTPQNQPPNQTLMGSEGRVWILDFNNIFDTLLWPQVKFNLTIN